MGLLNDDEPDTRILAVIQTEKFSKLLHELENCNEDEQKQKIEEMNEIIDGMNKDEFETVFTEELFDNIHQMIEEKKLSVENVIGLLKRIGYCCLMKKGCFQGFPLSYLRKGFEKMISDENEKKDGKNEMLYADLCLCYLSLRNNCWTELLTICMQCLLKVALKKEESEEVQKEVEMALLALSDIEYYILHNELYLKEIKEIIIYHQDHRNLTQLAYQSAWGFLTNRLFNNANLEEVIVNDLHFVREARREMEELMKYVDWKREKEERGKEGKEEIIISKWLQTLGKFLFYCRLRNEEYSVLVESIVQAFRAAKDNYRDIVSQCVESFSYSVNNRNVKVEDFLKRGAVSLIFEEICRPTLNDEIISESLLFLMNVSEKLKEEEEDEKEEAKRKVTKRNAFEKLEEEGYEDIIICFHERFGFLNRDRFGVLSLCISDYFVNV
ncbi:uncharacterized protein MONOS_15170 [Monocercomonoides exilis]|uniref:uncharacterized protein n=1 Tax=Monocercomonoides exilis TaxID=2049356 RepID=UPI00355ACAE8|nr:hypothetical protein MONOS_15170 [Monocercomonoides exilis]|eukprot:MONOS_15170.1-p1 / transcript=MONOS_15170.1 / gene=MONOS_15170 / organism=Monocercomonoides_exilis_PA203 / gene_product=unspecified product / transcript_product=unspecified product / location=Mono_scaffold01161:9316-10758(-) / protein_length=441 / sequence_SO=supercontig / SO=protein_coding / is_pseudo=false